MTQNEKQTLLNALKLELQFCESGGYKTIVETLPKRDTRSDPASALVSIENNREFRKERSIFQDSPWCLNYRLPIREHPCSACWLINFVPAERHGESVPCHYIPLNERGDTLASLGGPGDAPHVQHAVRAWLRAKIRELEAAQSR